MDVNRLMSDVTQSTLRDSTVLHEEYWPSKTKVDIKMFLILHCRGKSCEDVHSAENYV
jgi:hypothetical protein